MHVFVIVKGATRTAVSTPDGRCFFAYTSRRKRETHQDVLAHVV